MATATPIPSSPSQPISTHAPSGDTSNRGGYWLRLTLTDLCYAREMLIPMSIGVIVLIVALAGNFVYWAINSIVNQGMSILPVLKLFLLAAPGFAVQGIPAGVILAVCLVLNRAVRDNEIMALRVGGASIPRILAPFLLMSLFASAFDWWMVEKVTPYTNSLVEKELLKIVSRATTQVMDSDKYFRVGTYYFYVQYVDSETHVLHKVMIYERGGGQFGVFAPNVFPTVLVADTAREDPQKRNRWILEKGVVHTYDDNGRLRMDAPFRSFTIDVGQELSTYWAEQKAPFSMKGDELWQRIEDLERAAFPQNKVAEMRVDYYRRFALPLACFVMALLAAPLALRYARQGSFAGLVLAFALAFFWQGFDGWFRALGIARYLSAPVAAWATNGLFLIVGAAFLWRER
ncbi:MAG: LptF/LptG family permease [Armatimonadota bacterium]|nr:LptF/LptG family permease [Armatimonadota bacterium]